MSENTSVNLKEDSINIAIENNERVYKEYDDTELKKNISDIKEEQAGQNQNIQTNKEDIKKLQEDVSTLHNYDDTVVKEDIQSIQAEQINQNNDIANLKTNLQTLEDTIDSIGADNIAFSDGQTFQEKYDSGELKGPKGDKGEQGIQGEKGDTGERGIQGERGLDGAKGEQGEKGQDGVNGIDGTNGEDGFSPTISERTNTATEYVLTITNKDNSYDTPNLKGADGTMDITEINTKLEEISSKIDNIGGAGGVDISEYFGDTINEFGNERNFPWITLIKQMPTNITVNVSSFAYLFAQYPNIQIPIIKMGDTIKPTSFSNLFYGSKLKNINFEQFMNNIDTTAVLNMNSLFAYCTNLETINFGENFNTSNATNMNNMFEQCKNLDNLDLSYFNTEKVINMSFMFSGCSKLTNINFGENFDTSEASSLAYIFSGCSNLKEIPLLNASKVNNVNQAFINCSELEKIGGFYNLGESYSASIASNSTTYEIKFNTSSKLTHESLMNIINNLYDIATKGCNAQKLTLGTTNIAKLTEEEIAIATNKGWTVS